MDLQENLISLDEARIIRGREKICKCPKRKVVIDTTNRRVTCSSCGAVVDPYDALLDFARRREELTENVERLLEQRKEIASYKPWLKVIKNLESHYRGHKMIPNCPRCSEPFYLEELVHWTGKPYADARIKRYKEAHEKEE
ncbi:MAG: hypothetical protein K0Q87_60 [Neobacillus sp.]|jgi:hypothetical protein|nr:hypothetical protein [Neobacillus sp.]